jgi:hypothetical protein
VTFHPIALFGVVPSAVPLVNRNGLGTASRLSHSFFVSKHRFFWENTLDSARNVM